ncbi:ankyrin repeat-containing domain protein [Diaporthe sp. PMI_573]|nr:ankyrin repeat-containing domain protein [Diaporthaceae sp. PMI_573]
MASPSGSTQRLAPYHEFQRRRPQVLPNWTSEGECALRDHDGSVLHETEYSGLLCAIIERNDVVLLRRYLALHPSSLGPADIPLDDPFWTAAAHGCTDALDVMLQHWDANPSVIPTPDARGFRLLHVACAHAQLDTVRFLMDERAPWASRFGHAHTIAKERDAHGHTAILSAATWYRYGKHLENDDSGELIRLLLSNGARATDAIFPPSETEPLQPLTMVASIPKVDQPIETVLSLAVSGASADTIVRLVNGGADVHTKTIYVDTNGLFEGSSDVAWDVTPLHIASLFANFDGIEELRDRRGEGVEWKDMVSRRDSHGRLPLHWAAGGHWAETAAAPDDILRTMELLLADQDTEMVNSPDTQGYTPLRHAVRSSIAGVAPEISYQVTKFLCEKGARAGARGNNGRTPLHCLLSAHAVRPSRSMMALCKLLLAHGASVGDRDADGNTVLHLVARSTQHLETVRFLLDEAGARTGQGARDHILHDVNGQGNTPLHVAAAAQSRSALDQSAEDRIRSQDAMMRALTPELRAYGGDGSEQSLLDQPNKAGKTPRQLCQEMGSTRWQQQQNARQPWTAGLGRGRGRGRNVVALPPLDSPW